MIIDFRLFFYFSEYAATGVVIDSRVYTYAISLEQTKKMLRLHANS